MQVLWGAAGMVVLLLIAFALSTDRRAIRPRTVFGALAIQLVFAFIVLRWDAGKQAWVRALDRLEPHLVVDTGDNLAAAAGVPAALHALEPLLARPGAFVLGSNDYHAPHPANPARYLRGPSRQRPEQRELPWRELVAGLTGAGWVDLTNARAALVVGGRSVDLVGVDDPHLRRARYSRIAGPAESDALVRIGVTHSPEPYILRQFAADGYDLVLAGHTHGGQVRIPFGPAIVTNCGIDVRRARWLHRWDDRMWFHICAGLGTNPYMPIRFACRPEASLLTLTARA